jgi:hypothetical protein
LSFRSRNFSDALHGIKTRAAAQCLNSTGEDGAVELVQSAMYGAGFETDFEVTTFASKDAALTDMRHYERLASISGVRPGTKRSLHRRRLCVPRSARKCARLRQV